MKIVKRSYAKGYVWDIFEKKDGTFSIVVIEHHDGYCTLAPYNATQIQKETVEDLIESIGIDDDLNYTVVNDLISIEDCYVKITEVLDEESVATNIIEQLSEVLKIIENYEGRIHGLNLTSLEFETGSDGYNKLMEKVEEYKHKQLSYINRLHALTSELDS